MYLGAVYFGHLRVTREREVDRFSIRVSWICRLLARSYSTLTQLRGGRSPGWALGGVRCGLVEGLAGGALAQDDDHAAAEHDDALDGLFVLGREGLHAEELRFGEECGEGVVEGVTPA